VTKIAETSSGRTQRPGLGTTQGDVHSMRADAVGALSCWLCHSPAAQMSFTVRPGGSDCFSLSAFSKSLTHKVYKYLLQRTLNFTTSLDFLILTAAQHARRRRCSVANTTLRSEDRPRALDTSAGGHRTRNKQHKHDPPAAPILDHGQSCTAAHCSPSPALQGEARPRGHRRRC